MEFQGKVRSLNLAYFGRRHFKETARFQEINEHEKVTVYLNTTQWKAVLYANTSEAERICTA